MTPLHIASKKGFIDVVKILLDAKADVHAICQDQSTSLHLSAQNGHSKTCELLLIQGGAKINAKTSQKWTPLHESARWGRTSTCALLVKEGAEINATDELGETPLDKAIKEKKTEATETVALLKSLGAKSKAEL